MKKAFLVILVLTVFFISCDDNDMKDVNPFVGIWENEITNYRIVFTKTVIAAYYPNEEIYWTGTYTYDEKTIRAKLNIEKSAQEIINASVDGIFVIEYAFIDDKLYFNASQLKKIG